MWILLAITSSLCLGVYDIFKKLSLTDNNVLSVLFLNTLFGAMLMSPVWCGAMFDGTFGFAGGVADHCMILLKSVIVLASWVMGYFAVKHLPLTITGPVNATRPILVLVGALVIFGESLNALQWIGILLGFCSLFFVSRLGKKEGFSFKHSVWIWLIMGATLMGAVSGLYDKYLLRRFDPLQVQAWYSLYQCVIMGSTILLIKRFCATDKTPMKWRWTIPCIAIFLTIADMAYFYSLSIDGSMISVVSMIRRGSVLVSFAYGVIALHEKNVKMKLADLSLLLVGLVCLVLGSR